MKNEETKNEKRREKLNELKKEMAGFGKAFTMITDGVINFVKGFFQIIGGFALMLVEIIKMAVEGISSLDKKKPKKEKEKSIIDDYEDGLQECLWCTKLVKNPLWEVHGTPVHAGCVKHYPVADRDKVKK